MSRPRFRAPGGFPTRVLVCAAWRFPLVRFAAPHDGVVLLYHGVPRSDDLVGAEAFERHVRFLQDRFEIVPHSALETRRGRRGSVRLALTFDDGFRNNAEVVAPILRRYGVPALFFISNRHSDPAKYLWFAYLRALESHFDGPGFSFRGEYFDMRPATRARTALRLRETLLAMKPHPGALYEAIERELPHLEDFVDPRILADRYAGMSEEQVARLAGDPLFEVGGHTVDHPFLTRCEPGEITRQLEDNQRWLKRVSGKPCAVVAYPSGDYDASVVRECLRLGFTSGHAVVSSKRGRMETPRFGIYSASTDALAFKTMFGPALRTLGLRLG